MFKSHFSIALLFCAVASLSFMSCTDECEEVTITLTSADSMRVTESASLVESIVIDTFKSAPQYVGVLLNTDAPGFDPCTPTLSNPINEEELIVTFNKDILIDFNTVTPAYSNLFGHTLEGFPSSAPQVIYNTRNYSQLMIPINQEIVRHAYFDAESVTIAYHITTSDGIQLSDSTTVVLDY